MRVLLAIPFLDMLNNLPAVDRRRCHGYIQRLFKFIGTIPDETHFSKIPFSNYYITYEQKISTDKYANRLRVYRVLFDGFRIFFTVKGRSKPVCKFVYIDIIKP